MIVSFRDLDGKVQRVSVEIIKKYALSSAETQLVLVTADGETIAEKSWVGLGYQVVSATTKELYLLKKIGLNPREQ